MSTFLMCQTHRILEVFVEMQQHLTWLILYFLQEVDPFHPESVRASGGTIHLHSFVEMELESYQSRYERPSFMLSSNEGKSLYDCTFEKNITFIVGSEMGFSDDIKGCLAVTIPMNDAVDSLNVSVSTGIALSYLYSRKIETL